MRDSSAAALERKHKHRRNCNARLVVGAGKGTVLTSGCTHRSDWPVHSRLGALEPSSGVWGLAATGAVY